MEAITATKAKAGFRALTRRVIKSRKPVVVQTPEGFVQIAPYDLPDPVSPAPTGALGKFSGAQYRFANTFGDAL